MEKKQKFLFLVFLLTVLTAVAVHYRFDPWGFYWKRPAQEAALRRQVVQTAERYLGYNEADKSHRTILNRYNSHEPLAAGYLVQETDSWCAAFVSAVSIECGLTQIIPTECSCGRQIELFQALGSWEENDRRIPLPGDIIYYDWDQKKPGEASGWPDHVGIVVGTKWPFLKVIEGNKEDTVAYRVLLLGDIRIRGFGLPDYAAIAKSTP